MAVRTMAASSRTLKLLLVNLNIPNSAIPPVYEPPYIILFEAPTVNLLDEYRGPIGALLTALFSQPSIYNFIVDPAL